MWPFVTLKSCFTPAKNTFANDLEMINHLNFQDYLLEKYSIPENLFSNNRTAKSMVNTYLVKNKKVTLSSIVKSYKVTYPKGQIPSFLLISLLFGVALACNSGVTVNAVVNNCININSTHEQCNSQFSTSVSIDRIFNIYCGTIVSNNVPIGSFRVGYIGARTKLNYNLSYYTSAWVPFQQSNFRCANANGAHCTVAECQSVNRTAYGNLNYLYFPYTYGDTDCDLVPAAGANCFFAQDACLFSGWGIIPESSSVNAVYRYNNYNPVEVDLFVEVTTGTIYANNLVTLSNSQSVVLDSTFGFPGTTEMSLDLSPTFSPPAEINKVSYPSGFTSQAINDIGTFSPNKVGDIQSNTPSSFADITHYASIVTQPGAVLSNKQIANHGVQYSFYTPGLVYGVNNNFKLPASYSNIDYTLTETGSTHYSNFNGVQANLTNPGPIILSFISQFEFTRTIAPCTFEIEVVSVQGCCSCNTNAYLQVSIIYDSSRCLINYFSRDINILTVTNSIDDRIYFSTDDCSQNIHISAESTGYSQNIEYYISLEEPIIESFSNGITTIINYETSYDIDGTSFDLDGIHGFLPDFFNKDTLLRNLIILFVCLLLGCVFVVCIYKMVLSFLCSLNPYKKML